MVHGHKRPSKGSSIGHVRFHIRTSSSRLLSGCLGRHRSIWNSVVLFHCRAVSPGLLKHHPNKIPLSELKGGAQVELLLDVSMAPTSSSSSTRCATCLTVTRWRSLWQVAHPPLPHSLSILYFDNAAWKRQKQATIGLVEDWSQNPFK